MFTIQFATSNAIFATDPRTEIARLLHKAAFQAETMNPGDQLTLRELNGNSIGTMTWDGDDEPE